MVKVVDVFGNDTNKVIKVEVNKMGKKYNNPPIVEETSVIYKPRKRPMVLRGKTQEDIKLLEKIYTFENLTDIRRFLWTHQSLIEILFEGREQIKRIFGEEITLSLELHHDPEEDFEELFIVIKTTYPPEKARKLMDKLGDEWFLDIMDKTEGNLCITEEPL